VKPGKTDDQPLRRQLVSLLRGGQAHITFNDAVKAIPANRIGVRPPGSPHSAWELLEHMRIAQRDILLFSKSAKYVAPKWPDDYWPSAPAPQRKTQWAASIKAFRADLAAFEKLVLDPKRDLHAPFAWGDGQTLLREALLIADHNAYHLGQLLLVGKLLGGKNG
jgi:hypothetical protein